MNSLSNFNNTPSKKNSSSPSVKRNRSSPIGDRFIPNRATMNFDMAQFNMTNSLTKENDGQASAGPITPSKSMYKATLANALLSGNNNDNRILTLQARAPAPPEGYVNPMKSMFSQNKLAGSPKKKVTRLIPQNPEKVLDAPELMDDYYLNLLDWSSTNTLAVALGKTVYLWNATSGTIEELMQTQGEEDHVTSVSFVEEGNFLAIGTNSATVQIWDVAAMKQVRSMRGHQARVGSLAWNNYILSSGSRDSNIHHHDVRIAQHLVGTLAGHSQEVCGLKWSPNGEQLASGGNDNILNIWNGMDSTPKHSIAHHTAAVKALAWSPHQTNLIASGGGTADRKICFWNTQSGALLNEIDTGSQVCSLQWSRHEKEILSSHGFTQNQLCLWSYPSMAKISEMYGHQSRVLHLAQSPDGNTVVSGAADETLRFWKCFGSNGTATKTNSKSVSKRMASSAFSSHTSTIR